MSRIGDKVIEITENTGQTVEELLVSQLVGIQ